MQNNVFLKRNLQPIIKISHCLQPTATVSRTTNMQDRTPPTSREETFEELRRAPFSSLEPQLRLGAPPQHIRAATKRLLTPEFRRPIRWGPIVSELGASDFRDNFISWLGRWWFGLLGGQVGPTSAKWVTTWDFLAELQKDLLDNNSHLSILNYHPHLLNLSSIRIAVLLFSLLALHWALFWNRFLLS